MDEQQITPPLQQQPEVSSSNVSLPSSTDILKQAWTIYKKRLRLFWGVMVIPIITAAIIWAAMLGSTFFKDGFFSSITGSVLFVSVGLLFFVAAFVVQGWSQTALLYAVKDHQENIGVKEAYRRGWPKIISYWWVNALTGFIIMGGFLLFIAPGIILAVWFSLASFILIAENTTGMNTLLKSREYIRGNWGAVFSRYLFIGLLSLVYFLAPIFIFMILGVFLKIPFKENILQVVAMALNLFWAPIVIIYSFLIYNHLKALKAQVAFNPSQRKKAGFILLAIFGFLIVPTTIFIIIFSTLGSAQEKSRNVMREVNLQQARVSLEKYYIENGKYPASLVDGVFSDYPSFSDPKTKQLWRYEIQPDGKGYKVCVQLEKSEEKCLTNYAPGSF